MTESFDLMLFYSLFKRDIKGLKMRNPYICRIADEKAKRKKG